MSEAATEFASAVAAHAGHYAGLLEREGPSLDGSGRPDSGLGQLAALSLISTEMENQLAAVDMLLSASAAEGLLPAARWMHLYFNMTGRPQRAIDLYQQLRTAAHAIGHAELRLSATLGLGRALFSFSALSAAQAELRAALDLAAELGDRHSSAAALSCLASAHYRLGDYSQGIELQRQALEQWCQLDNPRGQAATMCNLAVIHYRQGETSQAEELLTAALELFRQLGDSHGEAIALDNLGLVCMQVGRRELGLDLLTQSQVIRRRIGDRQGEAGSYINLAVQAFEQGDYSRTVQLCAAGIELCRQIGETHLRAYLQLCLAAVHLRRGNHQQVLETHAAVLEPLRRAGDEPGMIHSCLYLSASLAELSHWSSAVTGLQGVAAAAGRLGLELQPADADIQRQAWLQVNAALERGDITADELASYETEARILHLDGLADRLLAAGRRQVAEGTQA